MTRYTHIEEHEVTSRRPDDVPGLDVPMDDVMLREGNYCVGEGESKRANARVRPRDRQIRLDGRALDELLGEVDSCQPADRDASNARRDRTNEMWTVDKMHSAQLASGSFASFASINNHL